MWSAKRRGTSPQNRFLFCGTSNSRGDQVTRVARKGQRHNGAILVPRAEFPTAAPGPSAQCHTLRPVTLFLHPSPTVQFHTIHPEPAATPPRTPTPRTPIPFVLSRSRVSSRTILHKNPLLHSASQRFRERNLGLRNIFSIYSELNRLGKH